MPYRIDLRAAGDQALEQLIDLGALDVEACGDGSVAAIMPDRVRAEDVARALGTEATTIAPAAGRDEDSVWLLRPRTFRAGALEFAPAAHAASPGAIRLVDAGVFGTGLHPTTALCLEALQDSVAFAVPDRVLDLGAGSGILALAALRLGVPRAVAIDIDAEALRVAAENAKINGLSGGLRLALGGPEVFDEAFPLVLANVLAAPLIEMAPVLVRRIAHEGRVILSGIPSGVEAEVAGAYRRLGMRSVTAYARAGWAALVLQATW